MTRLNKVPSHIKEVRPRYTQAQAQAVASDDADRETRRRVSPVLRLPIPPSNNRYKRHFCTRSITEGPDKDIHEVRASLTEGARSYRGEAGWTARQAHVELVPKDREVVIIIEVYQATFKQVDLDNIPKVLFDALEGIAFVSDEQVSEFRVRRHRVAHRRQNRIEVQIFERDEWERRERGERKEEEGKSEHTDRRGARCASGA